MSYLTSTPSDYACTIGEPNRDGLSSIADVERRTSASDNAARVPRETKPGERGCQRHVVSCAPIYVFAIVMSTTLFDGQPTHISRSTTQQNAGAAPKLWSFPFFVVVPGAIIPSTPVRGVRCTYYQRTFLTTCPIPGFESAHVTRSLALLTHPHSLLRP